jgi:hypothetical protein
MTGLGQQAPKKFTFPFTLLISAQNPQGLGTLNVDLGDDEALGVHDEMTSLVVLG